MASGFLHKLHPCSTTAASCAGFGDNLWVGLAQDGGSTEVAVYRYTGTSGSLPFLPKQIALLAFAELGARTHKLESQRVRVVE